MSLIAARDVSVSINGKTVLDGIDLSVDRGEIVTIVGPNGSGKSTLMRVLIGAVKPDEGRVERQAGLVIGYVPQRLGLDQTMPMTVRRFLGLPLRRKTAEIDAMMARLGITALADQQITTLSGGQFQRVMLGRALLRKPDILVLDEPTQGLDQPGVADFYTLIDTVRQEMGCAVLMVSHDLHVVMSASDRVICLNGHVCCHGTPAVVSAAPEYRALFGLGTHGALAIYRHEHDHNHDHDHDHDHTHHHGDDHGKGAA